MQEAPRACLLVLWKAKSISNLLSHDILSQKASAVSCWHGVGRQITRGMTVRLHGNYTTNPHHYGPHLPQPEACAAALPKTLHPRSLMQHDR